MTCAICKGSGIAPAPHLPGSYGGWMDKGQFGMGVVCRACDGTGYTSSRGRRERQVVSEPDKDSIGKVIQYYPGLMTARLTLEETLHVGNRLLIQDADGETEFELGPMLVSKMAFSMALAGWEVAIQVPRPVDAGARIYRIGA